MPRLFNTYYPITNLIALSKMDKNYLRKLIYNTLTGVKGVELWSEDVENLLMGTCAQESALGRYREQLGGGPALGIFQMEPNTFNDIIKNYLAHKTKLKYAILNALGVSSLNDLTVEMLIDNDEAAIIFARLHYLRVKESIPHSLPAQAAYYKKYYNTPLGKATEEEYIRNYHRYVSE